jgi:hypothetical protein
LIKHLTGGHLETFPDHNFRGATATISVKADSQDYERLKVASKAAGLGQSHMLHLLLEMMRLRLASERSKGNFTVDMFGNDLEAFIWLVAQDSGLVDGQEAHASAWVVMNTSGGATFKDRQDGLFELLQKRFAERYGDAPNLSDEAEPFEAVDDDHPARMAAEIKEQASK